MEQMRQNEAGALTAQAIPQKDVEQACFHALGLIGRNDAIANIWTSTLRMWVPTSRPGRR